MGINPTPTNHRSFTFDGKSTREFGVYTTGKDVFNSPERAVEMISIPGRDGEYALDQGHFNNIEVTYKAGIVADSTTDFAEAISDFRNWLASRKGYCRLTDEYNTEEYRMAVFKNAIALEHEGLLTGEFDVTFDCKPQRYLAIGEELTEIGAWGNTETAEGEVVTIDASSDTAVKALTADIDPIQDLHGYDAPWVGGAGVNLFKGYADYNGTQNGVVFTYDDNGKVTLKRTASATGASALPGVQAFSTVHTYLDAGTYTLSSYRISGSGTAGAQILKDDWTNIVSANNSAITFTMTTGDYVTCRAVVNPNESPDGVWTIQLQKGSPATAWQPYENICPISGHDEVGVSVVGKNLLKSTVSTGTSNGVTYTVNDDKTISLSGTASANVFIVLSDPYHLSSGNYTMKKSGNANVSMALRVNTATGVNAIYANTTDKTATLTSGNYVGVVRIQSGTNTDGITIYPQLELGTTATEYEPYIGQSYNTQLGQTVYGGTLDVVSGTLKPAPYYASYNGEVLEGEWVSDRDKYVAGTTPTIGAQVVNIGKVGTATQLTGQSIELLEGENNIFADSGNVTVEYGHNPTLLTNPTWFPSKPLLAVDGYGEIKLNDYNMRIQDVPVGDITLVGASSFFLDNGSNGGTTSFTIDESELNTGDKITVSIEKLCFDVIINAASGYNIENRYTSDMSDENEHFVSPTYSYYSGTKTVLKYTGNMSASISFDVGTSSTVSGELPSYIKVRKTSPSPLEIEDIWFRLYPTVSYNANIKKITISWYGQSSWQGVVGSLPTFLSSVEFRNTTNQSKLDSIKAYSTKSTLTDTIYVDCEIGECYTIRNGSVITLNDTVTLGSDLPTLPSGDTEVTYDNTITKVEVKPNWWKV